MVLIFRDSLTHDMHYYIFSYLYIIHCCEEVVAFVLIREGWSREQQRVYDKALRIIDGDRLARLTLHNKPIRRRALLDRCVCVCV